MASDFYKTYLKCYAALDRAREKLGTSYGPFRLWLLHKYDGEKDLTDEALNAYYEEYKNRPRSEW